MNVVVDTRPMNAGGVAVGLRHPDDGRNVFVVPWRGCSVIGTYYRDYVGAPDAALRVERAWLDEFLAWLACVHPELRLAPHELRLLQAGLLPRARPGDTQPGDRPHIARGSCGELRVQPVKWTTAYGVAEQALDALSLEPRQAPRAARGLQPLLDARSDPARSERERSDAPFAGASFGAREVLFAVEREWARELADVLLRRTGAASTGHPGRSLVDAVSSVLQRKFDWPDAERRARIEEFDASFPFLGGRRP
jgi:glycerol-3-phosphate dehydrogenase